GLGIGTTAGIWNGQPITVNVSFAVAIDALSTVVSGFDCTICTLPPWEHFSDVAMFSVLPAIYITSSAPSLMLTEAAVTSSFFVPTSLTTPSLSTVSVEPEPLWMSTSSVESSSLTVSESVCQILTSGPDESGSSLSAQKQPVQMAYDGSPASNSTHTPA